MTERKCKSCGAPLRSIGFNKYICDYCGTLYEDEGGYIQVLRLTSKPAVTLGATCLLPNEMNSLDEEALSKYVEYELTKKLTEGLMKYTELKIYHDPWMDSTVARAYVRVIPPEYE